MRHKLSSASPEKRQKPRSPRAQGHSPLGQSCILQELKSGKDVKCSQKVALPPAAAPQATAHLHELTGLRNLHLLPLFGLLWNLGLGLACRPEVELSIPCEKEGHFSCPTGFHCGDEELCIPEEAPPLILPDYPSNHALVSGPFLLEGQISSPLGISWMQVSLKSEEEEKEGVEVPVEVTFNEARSNGRFRAELQSGWIPNGSAVLSIIAYTKKSGIRGVRKIPLRIHNDGPSLRLYADNLGRVLVEPALVYVSALSTVGLARFDATFGGVPLPFKVDWRDPRHLEAQIQILINPEDLDEGEGELHVSAQDMAGHESSLFRHFLIPALGDGPDW